MNSSPRRNVVIFKDTLLPYSETFIPAQAEKFQTFTPFYAGFTRVKGVALPEDRTLPLSRYKWISKARDVASIFGQLDPWFEASVRRIKPRLVHAHFEFGGVRALPIAQRLKIPLAVTCHGADVTENSHQWQHRRMLGRYYRSRRKRLLDEGDLFIGISRFICDQMLQRGYPPGKIQLHYIGVDPERFCPDPAVKPQPRILYVGRLVEKKGCIDLLEAMVKVGAKHPEVELAVLGDGPLRDRLQAFARERRLNVRFLGIQPPSEVLRLMRESLLFSMPSVRGSNGDSEGLGIVNLEAQAVGVPVIGTLHGGIPEAVDHGVTGLLCPERDPAALAQNILTLLDDTQLRGKMGVAARARMVEHFNLSKQSLLLEEIYQQKL